MASPLRSNISSSQPLFSSLDIFFSYPRQHIDNIFTSFCRYIEDQSVLISFMTILKGYDLPPGFRFHPTDEELIVHYLINQTKSRSCPVPIIPEVDIYKFDPWELPAKSQFGEKEWYFFSPRDRKYPNGARPNRATTSGYWKATGTDKAIYSGSKYVGVKKALVFYKGRPPKGIKTDWIMHEYRLGSSSPQQKRSDGSMRLDEWVLCRIYKKKQVGRPDMETSESPGYSMPSLVIKGDNRGEQSLPRPMSLSSLLDVDFSTMSYILNDELFGSMNGAQTGAYISTGSGGGSTDKIQSQVMEQAHFNYNMNQNLLYPQRNFS